ncbi:hypothetical protein PVL29_017359 [Vitis rotundifolia]|uniref:Cytochrome b5 heme-binding domain-containing protein n=1 Tax=Vitis rotundifolia TaxID=103349 RepID=A0AA39DIJ8_VITRO|nr:hypothetical protein PVL29_017359 [Vitis rotundifolia]
MERSIHNTKDRYKNQRQRRRVVVTLLSEQQKKWHQIRRFTCSKRSPSIIRPKIAGWLFPEMHDVTPFMDDHPGGDEVLLSATEKDATNDFDDVGHSEAARDMMGK